MLNRFTKYKKPTEAETYKALKGKVIPVDSAFQRPRLLISLKCNST
jgi:hypothetical protein